MPTKGYKGKYHKCKLALFNQDIVVTIIEAGLFVNFRRRVKRYTMVSQQHPLCRFFLNSRKVLRREQERHLILYYYMIHPFSMFEYYWRIYMSLILTLTFFIWPSVAPYTSAQEVFKIYLLSNISFFMLIIINFFMGYYDKGTNTVVMKPEAVVKRYLKTYFIFDLLALFPVLLKLIVYLNEGIDSDSSKITVARWILHLFKYARYGYFLDTLQMVKIYYNINYYLFKTVVALINFVFLIIFTTTIMYLLTFHFVKEDVLSHLTHMKSNIAMLLGVSAGLNDAEEHTILYYICPTIIIIIGFFVHLLVFIWIWQVWYQYFSKENKEIAVYDYLGAYMRSKALPDEIRERILLYLDFKFQTNFYKESCIKNITTSTLRKEILITESEEITKRVAFLKTIPKHVQNSICEHLSPTIFLPGDYIVTTGSEDHSMYFLLYGTVKIDHNGKYISKLRDGAHFGEVSLVTNLPRMVNVSAVTPCLIYVLHQRSIWLVSQDYPDLLMELSRSVQQRISLLQHVTKGEAKTSEWSIALLELKDDLDKEDAIARMLERASDDSTLV